MEWCREYSYCWIILNPQGSYIKAKAYELVRSHLQVVASSQCNAAVSAWDEEYESRWRLYRSHIVSVGYHILHLVALLPVQATITPDELNLLWSTSLNKSSARNKVHFTKHLWITKSMLNYIYYDRDDIIQNTIWFIICTQYDAKNSFRRSHREQNSLKKTREKVVITQWICVSNLTLFS